MEIVAFFPNSDFAWPGRKSAVIYTPGCNFECKFCYSYPIILNHERLERIPEKKILEMLFKNFQEVDSVVVSGGEPLLQGKKLVEFLKVLKTESFRIKLDTNASNSLLLEELLINGLLDFVSIDLKNQLNDYSYFKIAGKRLPIDEVLRSIQAVKYYGVDCEFRLTFVPGLHSSHDVLELAKQLKGCKRLVLQQFISSEGTLSNELSKTQNTSYEQLLKIAKQVQGIEEVRIRTLKGDEIISPLTEKIARKMPF